MTETEGGLDGRRVMLAGCLNFRDVGGYPTADGRSVRRGMLYRSDSLHRLTPGDYQTLQCLNLRTVLDLRSSEEVERQGIGLLAGGAFYRRHLPLTPVSEAQQQEPATSVDFPTMYGSMLTRAKESVSAIVLALADGDSYAAVIHCVAGKDRTGVVVAVILRALGVPDACIVQDYSPSGGYIAPLLDSLLADPVYNKIQTLLTGGLMTSPPEAMECLLARMDQEYASVHGYLEEAGVSSATVAQLRSNLLD